MSQSTQKSSFEANKLVKRFAENVKKFKGEMSDDILNAGPKASE